MEREQAIKFMRDLLKLMIEKKGSDLFITVGFPASHESTRQIVAHVQNCTYGRKYQGLGIRHHERQAVKRI